MDAETARRQHVAGQVSRMTAHMPSKLVKDKAPWLAPARIPLVLARLAEMPVSMRIRYLRSLKGDRPLLSITMNCLECVNWDRDEVARCTALACCFWAYRPGADE